MFWFSNDHKAVSCFFLTFVLIFWNQTDSTDAQTVEVNWAKFNFWMNRERIKNLQILEIQSTDDHIKQNHVSPHHQSPNIQSIKKTIQKSSKNCYTLLTPKMDTPYLALLFCVQHINWYGIELH